MKRKNSGYLGGDDAPFARRLPLLEKHIRWRPAKFLGWRYQCSCGSLHYVHWRKRWYCPQCGRWIKQFNIPNRNEPLLKDKPDVDGVYPDYNSYYKKRVLKAKGD